MQLVGLVLVTVGKQQSIRRLSCTSNMTNVCISRAYLQLENLASKVNQYFPSVQDLGPDPVHVVGQQLSLAPMFEVAAVLEKLFHLTF